MSFGCQTNPVSAEGTQIRRLPRHPPFDDKMDVVPLLQYPFEFGDTIGARSFEGYFVRDADDFHGLGVAGNLPVRDGDHVV